jgi:DNA-binding response OmpR family regulator
MNILFLEDERDLAEPVTQLLRAQRYSVTWVTSLDNAYDALAEREYDLAILDVMLPEGEDAGFELAEGLRTAGFSGSILFLTARDSVEDRIRGLDLGGDDYLIKPFSLKELLARTRALLRREAQTRTSTFVRGQLELDFAKRKVISAGEEVKISEREFAMLELLALHPEKVFAVEDLFERFFPDASSGNRVVRVYVNQLRQKVAQDVIETVPGGYVLGANQQATANQKLADPALKKALRTGDLLFHE